MRFLSANVYGINARENRITLQTWLDVMTLSFSKIKLKVGNNYHVEASCAESAGRGVVTISRTP